MRIYRRQPDLPDRHQRKPRFPLPEFMSFTDFGDGTGRLLIEPRVGDRGDHAISIVATDNGDDNPDKPLSDTFTFVVTVESDNEPPVIDYLGDMVAVVGESIESPVQVRDSDQEPLAYLLQGLPDGRADPERGSMGKPF